jgi:hypothetical protein
MDGSRTVTITGYTNSPEKTTDVIVPEKIHNSPVTVIGSEAFSNCDEITSIKLPSTISSIEYFAFMNCTNLKTINLPEGILSIGDAAFEGCRSLESINLPASLESLGEWVFNYCENLISINANVNNTNFSSTDGILFDKKGTDLIKYPPAKKTTFYYIPSNVNKIYGEAFFDCLYIEKIYISISVEAIETSAFSDCKNLKSIIVDCENHYYKDIDGILYNKDIKSLICVPAQTHGIFTIPNTVEYIARPAFYNCEYITAIVISDSLIDDNYYKEHVARYSNLAFFDCINLKSFIVSENNKFFRSVDGVLFDKTMEALVSFPPGRTGEYIVPEGVREIAATAFNSCPGLTDVK